MVSSRRLPSQIIECFSRVWSPDARVKRLLSTSKVRTPNLRSTPLRNRQELRRQPTIESPLHPTNRDCSNKRTSNLIHLAGVWTRKTALQRQIDGFFPNLKQTDRSSLKRPRSPKSPLVKIANSKAFQCVSMKCGNILFFFNFSWSVSTKEVNNV